jgi:hypothetical protein
VAGKQQQAEPKSSTIGANASRALTQLAAMMKSRADDRRSIIFLFNSTIIQMARGVSLPSEKSE